MSILLAILAGNAGTPRSILDQPAIAPAVSGQDETGGDAATGATGDVQPTVPLAN